MSPRWVGAFALGVLALASASCGGRGGSDPEPSSGASKPASSTAEDGPLDDAVLEKLYLRAKRKVEGDTLSAETLADAKRDLQRVADGAKDAHLRANASLLLGSLAEAADDRTTAVSYYRQAAELVPEEAAAHAVLAMALAADGKPGDAIPVQQKVVELVPDDLQAWLILGELNVKAGNEKAATEVYAAYEVRRKGLIDGLTLRNKDGSFIVSEDDRIGCAANLEGAADTGTAVALIYALETDPSPKVRAEVATVMGVQRLKMYEPHLEKIVKNEPTQSVKELAAWALSEIARDPVDTAPEPVPVDPQAIDEAADGGDAEGSGGADDSTADGGEPQDSTAGDPPPSDD